MAAFNFGKAAGNALSAGASGLQTGNPYIAGGAALLGGAASLFGDKFGGGGGNNDKQQQINRFNPQQQQAFSSALQTAQQGLASNKFDFAPKAAQARNNFAQQTIPGLLENFSKNGAQRSSSFAQALGSAGAGLNSDLAGMEQDYNLNERDHLMKLLGIGLEPQFDTIYEQGQEDQGGGIGDFLKNPQNLMNLYQLYQGSGMGGGQKASNGQGSASTPNFSAPRASAQQMTQKNLLNGNAIPQAIVGGNVSSWQPRSNQLTDQFKNPGYMGNVRANQILGTSGNFGQGFNQASTGYRPANYFQR